MLSLGRSESWLVLFMVCWLSQPMLAESPRDDTKRFKHLVRQANGSVLRLERGRTYFLSEKIERLTDRFRLPVHFSAGTREACSASGQRARPCASAPTWA